MHDLSSQYIYNLVSRLKGVSLLGVVVIIYLHCTIIGPRWGVHNITRNTFIANLVQLYRASSMSKGKISQYILYIYNLKEYKMQKQTSNSLYHKLEKPIP